MLCVYGSPLYQWDINRQLRIDTVDVHSNIMIHCCHRDDTSTLVVEPIFDGDVILVNIPNILLQRHGNIRVYVVVEGDTIYDTSFYVMARPKPDDYVYTETEILDYRRYEKIAKEQNAQSQAAATAAAASSAAAKQSETAAKESETNARECADSADVANAAAVAARDESVAARDASVSAAAASEQFRKDTADIKAAAEKSIATGLDAALSDISTSRCTAVNDIMDASDVAVGNVREEGVAQTNSIANAGENAVGEVTAVGEQVRGDVVSAGQTKLDEIANAKRGAVLYEVQVLEDTQKAQARSNISAAGEIVCSEKGENITLTDASDQPLHGLQVFGKSTQNGTPTPDAPVPIVSVGESGSVNVRITGKNLLDVKTAGLYHRNDSRVVHVNMFRTETGIYLEKVTSSNDTWTLGGLLLGTVKELAGKTITLSSKAETTFTNKPTLIIAKTDVTPSYVQEKPVFPNGYIGYDDSYKTLAQSPRVSSGYSKTSYTVTGEEGTKYIAVLFQVAYGGITYPGGYTRWDNIQVEIGSARTEYEAYKPKQTITIPATDGLRSVESVADEIDYARGVYVRRIGKIDAYAGEDVGDAWISSTGELSAGATVLYVLAEPTETPLTEEDLTAYRNAHTYKPNTTVYNDGGAEMEVSYTADTKTYIDNKFAALSAAILNNA